MSAIVEVRAYRGAALRALVWASALVLSLIGATAGIYRAAYVADATVRADPVRERLLRTLDRPDPRIADRPAELRRFDAPFAAHPVLTRWHVIPGTLFFLVAPLQFLTRLRNRYRGLHRWSGRVLVCALLASMAPALYFGLGFPFAGVGEAVVIAAVAIMLFTAVGRAFVAIRRGDVAHHREWMLRAYALTLGIASVRVVGAVVDVALTPLGIRPATGFVIALWLGWGLTAGVAELWIIHTRARARVRHRERDLPREG